MHTGVAQLYCWRSLAYRGGTIILLEEVAAYRGGTIILLAEVAASCDSLERLWQHPRQAWSDFVVLHVG